MSPRARLIAFCSEIYMGDKNINLLAMMQIRAANPNTPGDYYSNAAVIHAGDKKYLLYGEKNAFSIFQRCI